MLGCCWCTDTAWCDGDLVGMAAASGGSGDGGGGTQGRGEERSSLSGGAGMLPRAYRWQAFQVAWAAGVCNLASFPIIHPSNTVRSSISNLRVYAPWIRYLHALFVAQVAATSCVCIAFSGGEEMTGRVGSRDEEAAGTSPIHSSALKTEIHIVRCNLQVGHR